MVIRPINCFMKLDRNKVSGDDCLPDIIYVWGKFPDFYVDDKGNERCRYAALYQAAVRVGESGRVTGQPIIIDMDCLVNFYDKL